MIYTETERLIIRPLRLEDAASMFAYAKDPEMAFYVSWDPHQSIEDSRKFIASTLKETEKNPFNTSALGIALKDDPERIIGAAGIETAGHKYEGVLSYALGRKYWRQGIMFEVCSALLEKAFLERGYKRIFAWCIKENIASSALMKKLGMTYEGCLRSRILRHDRLWDVEYYSILENEWKLKNSLESRLHRPASKKTAKTAVE